MTSICSFAFTILIIIIIMLYAIKPCTMCSALVSPPHVANGFTSTYEGAPVEYTTIQTIPGVRTVDATMMVPDSYSWINRKLPPPVEYNDLEKIIDDKPEYSESLAKKSAYRVGAFPDLNAPSMTTVSHFQVMDNQPLMWYYNRT